MTGPGLTLNRAAVMAVIHAGVVAVAGSGLSVADGVNPIAMAKAYGKSLGVQGPPPGGWGHHFRVSAEAVAATLAATDIDAKYQSIGGPHSALGVSTGDVSPQTDGSFREDFRGGFMTRSADGEVKALQQRAINVRYRGLHCFGTTSGPGDDEPYVIVSVYQPEPCAAAGRGNAQSMRFPPSGTYENVDEGATRTEGVADIAVTAPSDLVVTPVLMEHDDGDPEKVRKAVRDAIQSGAHAAVAAASGGAATSAPLGSETLQGMALEWVTGVITDLLGSGDDVIDTASFVVKRDQMQDMKVHHPMRNDHGVDHNYDAGKLLSDGDASYHVYHGLFMSEWTTPREI